MSVNLMDEIVNRCSRGENVVLATITKTSGSTPRKPEPKCWF